MAGNSNRRGATRKDGTKKGMVVGSGGQRRRALEGRGPTPPADQRKGHPAQRRRWPPDPTTLPFFVPSLRVAPRRWELPAMCLCVLECPGGAVG